MSIVRFYWFGSAVFDGLLHCTARDKTARSDNSDTQDFLLQLRQKLESDPNAIEELQAKIKQISDTICQRVHMVSMLVTEEDQLKTTRTVTRQVLEQLPSRTSEEP